MRMLSIVSISSMKIPKQLNRPLTWANCSILYSKDGWYQPRARSDTHVLTHPQGVRTWIAPLQRGVTARACLYMVLFYVRVS